MKSKIQKVVLFADVLENNFDGVSVTLHKILNRVPKDRFDFLVITAHPPNNKEDIPFQIFECPYVKFPFQKGYRLGWPHGQKLKKAIDDFEPDLIHFTSPSLFSRFAIKYAEKKDLPVVGIYHTHFPTYWKYYIGKLGDFIFGGFINWLVLSSYKKSDLALVPTNSVKKDLLDLGMNEADIKIWGRAVSANSFSPAFRVDDAFTFNNQEEYKKVLFVSRLIREKEVATVYQVYKRLMSSDTKLKMIITGDGPKRDWMERKMPNAIFTGRKTGDELARIYASCDVFFFPSSTETFGNVVIEAMASGLPVVSANAGGPADLVEHNRSGFLVEKGEDEVFAQQILKLLDDDELRASMSIQAQRSVQKRSIEELHENLWDIYDGVIVDHAKKRPLGD